MLSSNFTPHNKAARQHNGVKLPMVKQPKDKLTDWSHEPKLSDLKSDLTLTRSSHDAHVAQVKKWLRDINPNKESDNVATKGKPYGVATQNSVPKTRSSIKSKLIRKQLEWRYTSLSEPFLDTPDIYSADPVTPEDVMSAQQNGLILNNQINTKMDKVAFIDEFVRTCTNEGTAVIKTGWDYKFETVEQTYPTYEIRPVTDEQQLQVMQQYNNFHPDTLPEEVKEAFAATQQTGQPHFPVKVGEETIVEERATCNQPYWEVCDFENIRFDPSCKGKLADAQFAILSYESNMSTLSKRGLYKNLDKIKVDSVVDSADHNSNWASSGFEFQDEARKKFVVYEYWGFWDIDGSGKTQPIVAEWVGDVLIRMELNPFPDKAIPFVVVPFMPIKDSLFGEPDGELLKENQQVAGALMRGMIDVFGRSANAQTGIRKGALDVLNRRRFDRGEDYEFNEQGDAQNSIHMHQFPEVPQSAYNFLNMQNQEAESLTGVIAFNQGVTGSGLGNTAAAANGALSAAARRELGILRRLSEGMKQIGHKFISMNQEFLSDEEVVRVTNKDFVTVRRDDLGGKIDLRLSISTAEANEQKAQELSFMLQTTAPAMGMDFTKLILAEIARLRKMPFLAQQIEAFTPTPDPMAEQLKQLELAGKQAEIQKTQAEIQKLLADTQLSSVKSTHTQADADLKNLEYVEEESGVNHARQLDVMEAQAESQSRTKLVEATLKATTDTSNK